MLKNYFKIALRILWRHKAFSLINIFGLAVGMAACFLIYLYVHFELSYDSFNTKANRIYRLATDIKTPSDLMQLGSSSPPMAINIQKKFPEVESFVRIVRESFLVRKDNLKFEENKVIMADSTLFKIFDFPLIYGDKTTVLKEPMSIVLSQTAAKKYFGNMNPIGQSVLLTEEALNATVTGVMNDIPANSQIQADMVVSMSSQKQIDKQSFDSNWTSFVTISFLLLRPNANPKTLEAKFPALIDRQIGEELKAQQMKFVLFLEPLKDVYLKSKREGSEAGSLTNVYIFSIIAIFIILIACINYINLTTARSVERAKEVGIRKVIGAARFQLSGQFTGESVIVCFIAFVIAVTLSALLLPLFNQLAGKQVSTSVFHNPLNISALFLVSVAIGVIAGFYPSLVLSSFKPVAMLKGHFNAATKGLLLRKGLIIFQFTISIILITGTLVVNQQLNYMRNHDLGFSKDQMMIIDTKQDKNANSFKESLSAIPGIVSTSFSNGVPGDGYMITDFKLENKAGDLETANLNWYVVDFNYLNQYKIPIIAGRAFSESFNIDSTKAMVINESAVKLLGYTSPKEVIGKNFEQAGKKGKIIGVVKNFHFTSLQRKIEPLIMSVGKANYQTLSVKLAAANLPATIKAINSQWNKIIPGRQFDYTFLDESFDKQYRAEERFGNLFLNFAILAIFISCLGLLGLALYSTIKRTKEIGVRKVLGASVANIVSLLSIDFLKLVLAAFIIALPIGVYFTHEWLQDFAYHINLSWWIFATAGIAAIVIAFGTISFQAIKAAMANPVKSLRTE